MSDLSRYERAVLNAFERLTPGEREAVSIVLRRIANEENWDDHAAGRLIMFGWAVEHMRRAMERAK